MLAARVRRLPSSLSHWKIRRIAVGAIAVCLAYAPRAWAVAVVIEVGDEAEVVVDSRLARRLIQLELADVDLPPSVGDHAQHSQSEVVFVRLLRVEDQLRVELWARGQPSGERKLDVSGTEQYQARRAALASAELVRRLRETRILERQRYLKRHLRSANLPAAPAGYTLRLRGGVSLGAQTIYWPRAGALLVGPRGEIWVRSEAGLGLGIFAGSYASATTSSPRLWTEVGLKPSVSLAWSDNADIVFGTTVSAAVVDPGSSFTPVSASESRQTWSARAAAHVDVQWWFGRRAALSFGPEAGIHLRDIAFESATKANRHDTFGGLWLGLGVRAVLEQ